jgi:nitrite reductase/ring-hydroxylating ferredoxin subunit
MKKIFFLLIILFLSNSCSDNKTTNNSNPYLPNYTFSVDVNLALPGYNILTFAGNAVAITQQNVGVRGVFVFNTGSGYTAFDMACPNQALATCSTMTLSGIDAVCPCDSKKYSLYTGLCAGQQYPMKAYRVEVLGTVLRVYN